ncbi:MAG: hypothetical protein ACT4QA_02185, partial [Panacagrimonas sp.]
MFAWPAASALACSFIDNVTVDGTTLFISGAEFNGGGCGTGARLYVSINGTRLTLNPGATSSFISAQLPAPLTPGIGYQIYLARTDSANLNVSPEA